MGELLSPVLLRADQSGVATLPHEFVDGPKCSREPFQGLLFFICLHTPPPLMCLFWCVCASVFAPVCKDARVCPLPCNIIRVLGLSFNKKLKLVSSLCTHTQVHYWIPTRNPVTCHDTSIAESRWASVATHHFYTFSHCYSCSTHFLS